MIYYETGQYEIIQYNDNNTDTIEKWVKKTWLCRYPRPTTIAYYRGNGFLGHRFKNDLIEKYYDFKLKYVKTENPQANWILEQIHQVVQNLIRTFDLQQNYLEKDDPWVGILAAINFAVLST